MFYDSTAKSESSAPSHIDRGVSTFGAAPQLPSTRSTQAESFQKSNPGRATNILASDVEIQGSLRFGEDLTIDGRMEGEIHTEGCLTIGENAVIHAVIYARSVVIFGQVEGNISTLEKCEIRSQADVTGDITAGTLFMEEGAAFTGRAAVGQWEQHAPAPVAQPEVIVAAPQAIALAEAPAMHSAMEVAPAPRPETESDLDLSLDLEPESEVSAHRTLAHAADEPTLAN